MRMPEQGAGQLLRSGCIGIILFIGLSGMSQVVYASGETSSIDSLKKEIVKLIADKNLKAVAESYEGLGWLYQQQYGYNKYTIDAYFKGLTYYGKLRDSLSYYNLYIRIGDYYTQDYLMQAYADQYLKRALRYFERTHNIPKIIECRLAIANSTIKKEPVPKPLFTELRNIEQLSRQVGERYFQAYAMNLLANSYSLAKQPDSAQYFAKRSLLLAHQLRVNWLIGLNHFYLGIVEQFKDNSRQAIVEYQQSYQIASVEKNISMLRELSRHSADSYSRLGDYKNAYAASMRALDYTNQFYYSEQTKSIRLQELNSQIKTLAVEKKLAEEQSRHQYLINLTLISFLIISVLGVVALIFLRRQQRLISHQQTVIAQQQIRDLELKSLRAMIEGQEGERSRIARELHDGLGIQLSRIKLFVEAHQELLPASVKEPLNQFLDEACTETRLISNDLRPYTLSTFGLIPALDDLVQKLNLVNQTTLTLEHYGPVPVLGDEASVMIYRVVQELLNNALKHAHAQKITVQVMTNTETTLISVDDDGQGGDFDAMSAKGNGIANIHSRIAYLGGQVIWQSKPGKGTSVMISLPMQ